MADLSKIKLNGTNYDLKDGYIRNNLKLLPILYYERYNDWDDEGYIIYKDTSYSSGEYYTSVFQVCNYGEYLVWLDEWNGEGSTSCLCTAQCYLDYTTPRINLETHAENSVIKFHIISESGVLKLFYDETITSEPLIITADWLGTDWELNAERGGRCFEGSSLTLNEFKQAINNHKDIYLRLYNRRNEECRLYDNSLQQYIYFISQNSYSNDLSLNYDYYLDFDNYYYSINFNFSFIYQMSNKVYLCSGGLDFSQDNNGTDIYIIEISSISDLSTSCPTLATVATSGSYNDLIDKPIVEPMANVQNMLTSFGLNASANLTQAQTGTAETDHAVAG